MTTNQIAYATFLESKRANEAREAETRRTNLENEAIRRAANQETYRSNLAREGETYRSNLERESQNRASLQEQMRSNLAQEGIADFRNLISAQTLRETERANKAREDELVRSNKANEYLKQYANYSQRSQTIINALNSEPTGTGGYLAALYGAGLVGTDDRTLNFAKDVYDVLSNGKGIPETMQEPLPGVRPIEPTPTPRIGGK